MKFGYLAVLIIIFGGFTLTAQNKSIHFEMELNAPPSEVYNAWTTLEGIKSFFAPDGKVELKKFGNYHIYFFPEYPEGSRGAEDELIISYEKDRMFSFTWGFPPNLPDLRENQKTVVNLRFIEIEDGKTIFTFTQTGWGEGEEWQKGYDYFINAWGKVVLARLKYRFEKGPIDWNNMPDLEEYSLVK